MSSATVVRSFLGKTWSSGPVTASPLEVRVLTPEEKAEACAKKRELMTALRYGMAKSHESAPFVTGLSSLMQVRAKRFISHLTATVAHFGHSFLSRFGF